MSEALTTIARDPRCLLAVSANDGGSWFAPLKEGGMTPRNFYKFPATSWPDFQSAFKGIGLDDFELELDIQANMLGGTGWCFMCSVQNAVAVGAFKTYPNLSIVLKVGAASDLGYVLELGATVSRRVILRLIKSNGALFIYVDGVMVATKSAQAYDISNADFESYPYQSSNSYIYAVKLTNLTKKTVAWEAPTSELYTAMYPYPSAVERNFATEPLNPIPIYEEWKSWDWYNHDWLIEFSYTPIKTEAETPLWNTAASYAPILFRKDATGFMAAYSTTFCKTQGASQGIFYPNGTADPLTPKKVTVSVVGNVLTLTQADLGTTSWDIWRNPETSIAYVPQMYGSGIGNSLKITDLTLGRVMWDFPSWPEKVRLLTYNNITTQNGFFTLANPSALGGVQTPLDLRGNTTSKTFICKANCHRSPDDGQLHSHALISQGYVWGTVANYCFGFLVRQDYRASARSLSLYCSYSGASAAQGLMAYPLPETVLDNTCVYVGVLDMVKKRCFLYLNGNLLFSTGITGEPWRANPQATAGIPVTGAAIRQEQHTLFLGGTDVYSAFVYEGALEAEEIAYISKVI